MVLSSNISFTTQVLQYGMVDNGQVALLTLQQEHKNPAMSTLKITSVSDLVKCD